jgi:hypothetical protein
VKAPVEPFNRQAFEEDLIEAFGATAWCSTRSFDATPVSNRYERERGSARGAAAGTVQRGGAERDPLSTVRFWR